MTHFEIRQEISDSFNPSNSRVVSFNRLLENQEEYPELSLGLFADTSTLPQSVLVEEEFPDPPVDLEDLQVTAEVEEAAAEEERQRVAAEAAAEEERQREAAEAASEEERQRIEERPSKDR